MVAERHRMRVKTKYGYEKLSSKAVLRELDLYNRVGITPKP